MLIKLEKVSKHGFVLDIGTPKAVGLAFQYLNGREPDEKWGKNNSCYERNYVIAGYGVINFSDRRLLVGRGNRFEIKPQEKHYITARNLILFTITLPNWDAEQYEMVE